MLESWETYKGKLQTGHGTSPRGKGVLQLARVEGVGDLTKREFCHQAQTCRVWSLPAWC